MKKLRVGIIGCGRIMPMHALSVKAIDSLELCAVCDVKKERADDAARAYGAATYYDYKVMEQEQKLDAVQICLPHYLHAEVSEYFLRRKIHVLCEKPMTIKYEDAERCVQTAEQSGALYGIIFQCRYNNSSVLVKKALTEGRLGKLISARSVLTWARPDSYYAESDWKGTWDKEGGGVIIDQAIHSIDLVNWFVDSPVDTVYAGYANRNHSIVAVEDSAEGLITYKNGVKYGFYCMNNYGYDEPIEIRLHCEKGHVAMSYDDAVITYSDGTVERAHANSEFIEYEGGKDYWGFQHLSQIRQFYSAVAGKEPLKISGREALKTQKLICTIYDSAAKGKKITL